ncbi:cysteine hydrolase family protein [Actinosynnema sp. NPDC047251]|uniref:Isochorismatase hydrolase n=1 Tax=Saccharothrix espanaensis (strain ATCC 51144 / DSM 44229 / JCM 9112 / NBRC 15066 / NRRL 15764) TaxID=1179773 RepID=K0KAN0_SACES|nr:cysteine hydrolase family protein [Saccharothrix espanaensis]CCH34572.1 Isochorismatase hydrolase [Saccharothrix espanaensis DSM 44229]
MTNKVLILIDVQRGFDSPAWGTRNNPDAEANIAALLAAWTGPLVLVRHDSSKGSLSPGQDGNRFKPELADAAPDLMFAKKVNSAFHGEVDLHAWLTNRGITEIVLAGIQTNMCVETTARVAGNLGYDVKVVLDATFTFGIEDLTADQLYQATATNLRSGGFAEIKSTKDYL